MLEKLRLVLSYEYDMPLEDVRPDLDLGQLRRPAAAAGVAGAVVVGDGAHDDDDQSGQQVRGRLGAHTERTSAHPLCKALHVQRVLSPDWLIM